MSRTLKKGLRDLAVLLVATVAWWLAENVANLGLPPAIAPLVGVVAMGVYRIARDRTQGVPQ